MSISNKRNIDAITASAADNTDEDDLSSFPVGPPSQLRRETTQCYDGKTLKPISPLSPALPTTHTKPQPAGDLEAWFKPAKEEGRFVPISSWSNSLASKTPGKKMWKIGICDTKTPMVLLVPRIQVGFVGKSKFNNSVQILCDFSPATHVRLLEQTYLGFKHLDSKFADMVVSSRTDICPELHNWSDDDLRYKVYAAITNPRATAGGKFPPSLSVAMEDFASISMFTEPDSKVPTSDLDSAAALGFLQRGVWVKLLIKLTGLYINKKTVKPVWTVCQLRILNDPQASDMLSSPHSREEFFGIESGSGLASVDTAGIQF